MGANSPGADEVPFAALQGLLRDSGLDGLLIVASSSRDADLAPFVGRAHLGESFLVVPLEGRPTLGFLVDMERDEARATGLELLGPRELGLGELQSSGLRPGELWFRVLTRAFDQLALPAGVWGIAGRPCAGTLVEAVAGLGAAGWHWRSGGEELRRWRKYKPPSWRARIAVPAAGVCAAMREVARLLAASCPGPAGLELGGEPLRVGRLREAVATELARHGLCQPEGNILSAGATAGVPHSRGASSHVVQEGEPLIVDLFPQDGFFADCTRTFVVGQPPAGFVEAHGRVAEALDLAHRTARAQMRGWELQEATCALFEAAGYPTLRADPSARRGYVHGLGHGVGFELHEYPSFRQNAGEEGVLEVGDLFTLEPGLYDSEAGYGVRLEDLCYLGEGGPENLTPLPVDWDPGAWPAVAQDGA